MTVQTQWPPELVLEVENEIVINAPIETAFEAIVEQLGPENQTPAGDSLSMKFEPWPGGRWYRDLGDRDGHLWGHVQVIKRPTLLEITGPLFMSHPVVSHVQYRLTEEGDGVRLTLRHRAVGLIDGDHRAGVKTGWMSQLEQIRKRAEA